MDEIPPSDDEISGSLYNFIVIIISIVLWLVIGYIIVSVL